MNNRCQNAVEQAREAIEALLPLQQASLTIVSRRLQMGSGVLKRAIRKHGLSYIRLRDEIRMRQSLQLLTGSDIPIAEVGFRAGYSEVACFYRAFKRWTGRTPGHYRAMRTKREESASGGH